jgi:23S rRNA (uracil1939-C5)-methyltransferase
MCNRYFDNSVFGSESVEMIQKKTPYEEVVTIDLLHEKGCGLGVLESGEPVGVYGALPGETVQIEVGKRKKRLRIGKIIEILKPHPARIVPRESAYLSTSPLQIVRYEWENAWKQEWIIGEFDKQNITLPPFMLWAPERQYGYRNKVEFAFFSDDEGLSLAFHQRGSNWGKIRVEGSDLLPTVINQVAQKILGFLITKKLDARRLKGLQINYSWYTDTVVVSLFTKEPGLPFDRAEILALLDAQIQGILVIYSDRQAPDHRITDIEHSVGNTVLTEQLGDSLYEYDFDMFFQSNIAGFSILLEYLTKDLQSAADLAHKNVLDLYAGVGTIGIALAPHVASVAGVEIMEKSKVYAEKNALLSGLKNYTFAQVAAEKMDTGLFENQDVVIVDPPRSGLTEKSLAQLIQAAPEHLVYISCNPASQARDMAALSEKYDLVSYRAYNLYPRTMHAEGVALLMKR